MRNQDKCKYFRLPEKEGRSRDNALGTIRDLPIPLDLIHASHLSIHGYYSSAPVLTGVYRRTTKVVPISYGEYISEAEDPFKYLHQWPTLAFWEGLEMWLDEMPEEASE